MWIENIKRGVELEAHNAEGEGLRKLKTSLGYRMRAAYKLTKQHQATPKHTSFWVMLTN